MAYDDCLLPIRSDAEINQILRTSSHNSHMAGATLQLYTINTYSNTALVSLSFTTHVVYVLPPHTPHMKSQTFSIVDEEARATRKNKNKEHRHRIVNLQPTWCSMLVCSVSERYSKCERKLLEHRVCANRIEKQ